jgi:hypothetical protein
MKITLKRNDKQIELIRAMASRDVSIAYEAQQSMADLMNPVLCEVLQQAPTVSNLFERHEYNSDDNPSLPLDLFVDIKDVNYISVWQQQNPGGLATNEVYAATQELKLKTYRIESAVSFDKTHAAKNRLDVVAKTFERLAQEILLQQEYTSANAILGALAAATTEGRAHTRRAGISGRFLPEDFNTTDTLMKRLWTSWYDGGTPVGVRHRVTDMLISPEITQELRRMAYNAINTRNAPNGGTDGVTAPEAYRANVFNNAGIPELWGTNFIEINELGVGQRFNDVFDVLAGSTNFLSADGTSATGAFDGAQDQIIIGLDRSVRGLIRPVAIDVEVGSELVLGVDNQWTNRQNKIGYFGQMDEGRQIIDDRELVGLIVRAVL